MFSFYLIAYFIHNYEIRKNVRKFTACIILTRLLNSYQQRCCCVVSSVPGTSPALLGDSEDAASRSRGAEPPETPSARTSTQLFPTRLQTDKTKGSGNTAEVRPHRPAPTSSMDMSHTLQMSFSISSSSSVWIPSGFPLGSDFSGLMSWKGGGGLKATRRTKNRQKPKERCVPPSQRADGSRSRQRARSRPSRAAHSGAARLNPRPALRSAPR